MRCLSLVLLCCCPVICVPLRAQEAAPASGVGVPAAGAPGGQAGANQDAKAQGVMKAPKLIHSADPKLTAEARQNHVSGVVKVKLSIGTDGLPKDVHLVQGLGYGLDEEALKAVSKYRFKPATRNGVPVQVDLYVDVHFAL